MVGLISFFAKDIKCESVTCSGTSYFNIWWLLYISECPVMRTEEAADRPENKKGEWSARDLNERE